MRKNGQREDANLFLSGFHVMKFRQFFEFLFFETLSLGRCCSILRSRHDKAVAILKFKELWKHLDDIPYRSRAVINSLIGEQGREGEESLVRDSSTVRNCDWGL